MKHTSAPRARRVYITDPRDWAHGIGTDYTLATGTTTADITSGTAGQVLSEYGWVTTSIAFGSATGADFISSADYAAPAHMLLADAGDRLQSPSIFGDYAHAVAVGRILGYLPQSLNLEVVGAFTTASNAETTSGFGLIEAGGSSLTANDHLAFIYSDGTNFKMRSGAATSAAGALIDTNWHKWKVRITQAGVEWYIDDSYQNSLALETDLFPCSFGAAILSATGANDVGIAHIALWYE